MELKIDDRIIISSPLENIFCADCIIEAVKVPQNLCYVYSMYENGEKLENGTKISQVLSQIRAHVFINRTLVVS